MSDKKSIFYEEQFGLFAVPLLAIERYVDLTSEGLDETSVTLALASALTICGLSEPSQEDYMYLVQRLQELDAAIVQPKQGSTKKSFATSYAEYLGSLDVMQVLGAMTQYDLPRMRELYCKVDFSHTKSLMKAYTEGLMEANVVAFEACMYGAGNSYKGDGAQSNVVDVDSDQGKAMLKQWGIGDVTGDMLEQLGINLEPL